jgi:hypothetical protein
MNSSDDEGPSRRRRAQSVIIDDSDGDDRPAVAPRKLAARKPAVASRAPSRPIDESDDEVDTKPKQLRKRSGASHVCRMHMSVWIWV